MSMDIKDKTMPILDEEDTRIEVGSGNVFADLGLPDPEERLVKADISIRIEDLVQERCLTQVAAASLMGLSQPDISNILRGRLKGFSVFRLLECLTALDQDVAIVIRPKGDGQERGEIYVAR